MKLMSPHKMLLFATVTAGGLDDSYIADDLMDGDPATPVRQTGASLSASIAAAAALAGCNGAVLANHSLSAAASAALSGDASASFTMPAVPPSGVRLNPWATFSPATVTNLSLAISGNTSDACIVGELLVGIFEDVPTFPIDSPLTVVPLGISREAEYDGLHAAQGVEQRQLSGTIYTDATGWGVLEAAMQASKNSSLPIVIVPFDDVNDAWLVKFSRLTLTSASRGQNTNLYVVDLEVIELPRYDWLG